MSRTSPRWDRQRRVDPRLLSMQFFVCVGSWTVLVFLLNGQVSKDGFVASVITGAILVAASWLMTKLGWNVSGVRPPEAALVGQGPAEGAVSD